MHPPEVKQQALALIAAGHNDCEVSRRMGIPRRTIMGWRRPTYVKKRDRHVCPRCWRVTRPMSFTSRDYSELLALYLGDGSISQHARTQRLRIALDVKYPTIIEDCRALLERCFPQHRVDVVPGQGCVSVSVYSSHLSCLFPQHGPGPKHERPISLERWQCRHIEQEPWAFLRGCIRSDGCCFVNRTGPYEYLSYDFNNMSDDIAGLFIAACELVDLDYRANHWRSWHIRINRRASVARMLEHVGVKE